MNRAKQISFNNAKEIERSFKIMGTAITAAFVSAGTAAYALTQRSINTADQMGKAAQKVGMSVEQFSGLAYAAKLANVSEETLSSTLVIMAKNLEKANQQTNQGKAAHTALGELFRGQIPIFNSTDDAFLQISQRLSLLPDGFQKSAIAAQLFGRNGAALLPLVNAGASGIEKMRVEAARFGIVISSDTAKKAEAFNDNLKRLETSIGGLGVKLASELLPYLNNLTDRLVNFAKNASSADSTLNGLKISVQVLATGVVGLAGSLYIAGNATATLIEDLAFLGSIATLSPGKIKQAWNELQASWGQTKQSLGDVRNLIADIWKQSANPPAPAFDIGLAMKDFQKKYAPPAPDEDAIKKIQAFIDKLKDEVATFGMSRPEIVRYELAKLGASEATRQFGVSLAEEIVKMEEGKKRIEDVRKSFENWPKPIAPPTPVKAEYGPTLLGTPNVVPGLEYPNALKMDLYPFRESVETLSKSLQRQADILNKEDRPAAERYQEALDHLKILQKDYGLTTQTYNEEVRKLNETFSKTRNVVLEVRQATSEMLTQAIFRANSFREAIGNLIERIAELIFQAKVLDPLLDNLFLKRATGGAAGGGGGGGLWGWLGGLLGIVGGGGGLLPLGPGFGSGQPMSSVMGYAAGGTAYAGTPILVGERGPEIFWPGQTGTIQPNAKVGGTTVYNIDARGAQRGVSNEILQALKVVENRAVTRARIQVMEDKARKA